MLATIAVIIIGHQQAQHMVQVQPMKMAAAEALWDTQDPASMSLITIGNEPQRRDVFAIRIPGLLSLLAYNRPTGAVTGINELQQEYSVEFGPGNYVPPVALSYWTFRIMVGLGFLMLLIAALEVLFVAQGKFEQRLWLLKWIPLALFLPYLANTTGWLFTELGRQPWIVFSLMKVEDAVSPNVPFGSVLFSLIAYTLVIGGLAGIDIWLLTRTARAGVVDEDQPEDEDPSGLLTGAAAR